MWLIARELVGVNGVPSSDRNIRELLKKLASEQPEKARKRQGSKATEYHISLLPTVTQAALYKKEGKVKVGDQTIELPKKEQHKPSYCREALWAKWNKTNNGAKAKARQALRVVQAVLALRVNGVSRMEAYQLSMQ